MGFVLVLVGAMIFILALAIENKISVSSIVGLLLVIAGIVLYYSLDGQTFPTIDRYVIGCK